MPQLVGRHLEEMANMRSSRQRRIVLISSIIVGVFLSYYAFGHFLHHRYFFGFFNLSTLLIIVANVRYLLK
ncbi:GGDEF domain-containing protein, partial [Vibrio genomosp. F10]